MERACEAAYCRALNQVVKRSFIAVDLGVSKSMRGGALDKVPYIVFIVYATYGAILGSTARLGS